MTRQAVVVVESTGWFPRIHQVFEIAVIVTDGDARTEKAWWLPVDLVEADPDALRENRYYEREIADEKKSDAAVVAKQLAKLVANAVLIGVTPGLAEKFLDPFLRANGQAPSWDHDTVCVRSLIAGRLRLQPPWPSTLELGQVLGVDPPPAEDQHTAMGDAKFALALYEAALKPEPAEQVKKSAGKRRKVKGEGDAADDEAGDHQPPADDGDGTASQPDDHPDPEADPDDTGSEAAATRPPGIPDPEKTYTCVNCGDDQVPGRQAQFSKSRWREILCKKCHTEKKPPS